MLRNSCKGFVVTITLLILLQENVPAQVPRFSDAFWHDVRNTRSGAPVAVRIADPFARLDQERALLKFLSEPHTLGWDNTTTVADIERDVGKHIALRIDHRALEEIGLTSELLLFSNVGAKENPPAGRPMDDPFADGPSSLPDTRFAAKTPEQRWWVSELASAPAKQLTNAAVLFHGLRSADLVLASCSGRWLITTEMAAEEDLSTRLYDVTPIADLRDAGLAYHVGDRRNHSTSRVDHSITPSAQTLIDVLQTAVDPDTWEVLGGPSTCRAVVINGRTWLVISAPVAAHWKVQALLNQLNGA